MSGAGTRSAPQAEQGVALRRHGPGVAQGRVRGKVYGGPGCASHMAWPAALQYYWGCHQTPPRHPVSLKIIHQIQTQISPVPLRSPYPLFAPGTSKVQGRLLAKSVGHTPNSLKSLGVCWSTCYCNKEPLEKSWFRSKNLVKTRIFFKMHLPQFLWAHMTPLLGRLGPMCVCTCVVEFVYPRLSCSYLG